MDAADYYSSLTKELDALRDRIRHFIAKNHSQTDGEWKESVLRAVIAQQLPGNLVIGRGFILTESGPTTQCDILIYRADRPVFFRQGDLAIVTPDAVAAIIEVKTTADYDLNEAIKKLAKIGAQLGGYREQSCLGLFAYESKFNDHEWILSKLREHCIEWSQIINFVSFGCDRFVRFWNTHPDDNAALYQQWHAYDLLSMSAGYFITNILAHVAAESIGPNSHLWFPKDSKERQAVNGRSWVGAAVQKKWA